MVRYQTEYTFKGGFYYNPRAIQVGNYGNTQAEVFSIMKAQLEYLIGSKLVSAVISITKETLFDKIQRKS